MRRKAQRLRTNASPLQALALRCDNGHEHLPWIVVQAGRIFFMTGEEAVYPYRFVEKVAACLATSVDVNNGDGDRSKIYELKLRLAAARRANAAAAGRQSRQRGAQLIQEYEKVITVLCLASAAATALQWVRDRALPDGFLDLPPHSRLLEARPVTWGEVGEDSSFDKEASCFDGGRRGRTLALLGEGWMSSSRLGFRGATPALCGRPFSVHTRSCHRARVQQTTACVRCSGS